MDPFKVRFGDEKLTYAEFTDALALVRRAHEQPDNLQASQEAFYGTWGMLMPENEEAMSEFPRMQIYELLDKYDEVLYRLDKVSDVPVFLAAWMTARGAVPWRPRALFIAKYAEGHARPPPPAIAPPIPPANAGPTTVAGGPPVPPANEGHEARPANNEPAPPLANDDFWEAFMNEDFGEPLANDDVEARLDSHGPAPYLAKNNYVPPDDPPVPPANEGHEAPLANNVPAPPLANNDFWEAFMNEDFGEPVVIDDLAAPLDSSDPAPSQAKDDSAPPLATDELVTPLIDDPTTPLVSDVPAALPANDSQKPAQSGGQGVVLEVEEDS